MATRHSNSEPQKSTLFNVSNLITLDASGVRYGLLLTGVYAYGCLRRTAPVSAQLTVAAQRMSIPSNSSVPGNSCFWTAHAI